MYDLLPHNSARQLQFIANQLIANSNYIIKNKECHTEFIYRDKMLTKHFQEMVRSLHNIK